MNSQIYELLQSQVVDLSKLGDVVKYELGKRPYMMNWLEKLMLFRLMI